MNSNHRLADVTDGTSTTLLLGERPPQYLDGYSYGTWYGGWGHDDYGATANTVLGVRETGVSGWTPHTISCPDGPYQFGAGSRSEPCSVFRFWSLHPGGGNFLFADGAVRFLSYSAEPRMAALATRAGGESVSGE